MDEQIKTIVKKTIISIADVTCSKEAIGDVKRKVQEISQSGFKIGTNGFTSDEYYFDDFELCK